MKKRLIIKFNKPLSVAQEDLMISFFQAHIKQATDILKNIETKMDKLPGFLRGGDSTKAMIGALSSNSQLKSGNISTFFHLSRKESGLYWFDSPDNGIAILELRKRKIKIPEINTFLVKEEIQRSLLPELKISKREVELTYSEINTN